MRASGSRRARTANTGGTAYLSNRSALLTSATSEIGFSTARRLAGQDATMLGSGREPRRGTEAANELRWAAGPGPIEFIPWTTPRSLPTWRSPRSSKAGSITWTCL